MTHLPRIAAVATLLLALTAPTVLGQEIFGRPIGEDDAPIGGPMVGGDPVGSAPIGGPMVGGAPAGYDDAPIGGPMVGGAPAGDGDAPVGGPMVGGQAVGQDDDDEAIGGAPVY